MHEFRCEVGKTRKITFCVPCFKGYVLTYHPTELAETLQERAPTSVGPRAAG
jgi:hypothetical protein